MKHAFGFTRGGARVVLAVLVATTLIGCRDLGRRAFKSPHVALRNVQLEGVGLDGGTLRLALLVENPNFYALSTAGMRYRLLVDDSVAIAEGVDTLHRRVAAHDSALVELPVHLSWRGLGAAGSAIAANGLVRYTIVGDIEIDTPVGAHDVPVRQSGRFAPLR